MPGKMGVWDTIVLIDVDTWLAPCLAALRQAVGDELAFAISNAEYSQLFGRAVRAPNLQDLKPHTNALRHGGASEDLVRHRRTPGQVLRRGRLPCPRSLRLYGKETRVLMKLAKVSQLRR